jgi:hypothetical protein
MRAGQLDKAEPQKALESFRMIDVQETPQLAPWRLQGEALALHALGAVLANSSASLPSNWPPYDSTLRSGSIHRTSPDRRRRPRRDRNIGVMAGTMEPETSRESYIKGGRLLSAFKRYRERIVRPKSLPQFCHSANVIRGDPA